MSEQQCKGCGLMVAEGYPRCPRCSMPLPRTRPRVTGMAGGTALEQEQESSSYLWIGLALLVLVIAAVVYVALDDDDAVSTSRRDQPTTSRPQSVQEPRNNSQEPSVGIPDDEPPTALENREQAVAEFERTLKADRLWSTLSTEDTTLKVVSSTCADTAMQPAIRKHAAPLSAVGLTKVRCVEKHGALVFEQSL